MLHSQALEHRINIIHESTYRYRLIYLNQHQLKFKKRLKKQDRQHTPDKFTNPSN